jgi:hypothetical protein
VSFKEVIDRALLGESNPISDYRPWATVAGFLQEQAAKVSIHLLAFTEQGVAILVLDSHSHGHERGIGERVELLLERISPP